MPSKKSYIFRVEGKESFPMDMLRYDSCFPNSPHDVDMMRIDIDERIIELVSNYPPTKARWESFGWNVIQIERGR